MKQTTSMTLASILIFGSWDPAPQESILIFESGELIQRFKDLNIQGPFGGGGAIFKHSKYPNISWGVFTCQSS